MVKNCCVHGCKSGSTSDRESRRKKNIRQTSIFKVPKCKILRAKWAEALSQEISENQFICEKHFREEDIYKADSLAINGVKIIVRRQKWTLINHNVIPINYQGLEGNISGQQIPMSHPEKEEPQMEELHHLEALPENSGVDDAQSSEPENEVFQMIGPEISGVDVIISEPSPPPLDVQPSLTFEEVCSYFSSALMEGWCYFATDEELTFIHIDLLTRKEDMRFSIAKNLTVKVSFSQRPEFFMDVTILSIDDIKKLMANLKTTVLCEGTGMLQKECATDCTGRISQVDFKRSEDEPRCVACQNLRQRMQIVERSDARTSKNLNTQQVVQRNKKRCRQVPLKMKTTKPNDCCVSCKSAEELFSLYETHEGSHIGDIEAPAIMIKECFNIEITPASNFTSICGECMLRLRDAYQFRRNVIASIQELQKQLCSSKDETILLQANSRSIDNKESRWTLKPGSDNLTENIKENNILNVVSLNNTLLMELSPLVRSKDTGAYRDAKQQNASDHQYAIQQGQTDCKICNLTFPTTKSLQGHMHVHFASYVCDKCSARFETDLKLTRHMATVHMEGPFICTICDQTYSKLNTLYAHIWRVHQALDPYKCSKCDQRFRTFHKRLRHLQEDHGMTEPMYPCPYCERKFFYAGSRSTHIRLTHLQERKHKCGHCPMAFGKRRMLLSHMSSIHDIGEKRHQCQKCQKRFFRSNTLKYHMKAHENAEQRLHQCSMCDARFSYKNHLKLHVKCHKNTQEEESIMECHKNYQGEKSTVTQTPKERSHPWNVTRTPKEKSQPWNVTRTPKNAKTIP